MADLLCTLMVLCRGNMSNGTPFWAYMCIKPSRAKMFYDARRQGRLNLEDYGTILEWGEGVEPPDAVKKQMRDKFGMRDDFEDLLLALVEKHS